MAAAQLVRGSRRGGLCRAWALPVRVLKKANKNTPRDGQARLAGFGLRCSERCGRYRSRLLAARGRIRRSVGLIPQKMWRNSGHCEPYQPQQFPKVHRCSLRTVSSKTVDRLNRKNKPEKSRRQRAPLEDGFTLARLCSLLLFAQLFSFASDARPRTIW